MISDRRMRRRRDADAKKEDLHSFYLSDCWLVFILVCHDNGS